MSTKIADPPSIQFDATTNDLTFVVTLYFPDGTSKSGYQEYVPGYQYQIDLAYVAEIVPPSRYAANQNSDGTTKAPSDPGYTATPDARDVASYHIAYAMPRQWSGPATPTPPTETGAALVL